MPYRSPHGQGGASAQQSPAKDRLQSPALLSAHCTWGMTRGTGTQGRAGDENEEGDGMRGGAGDDDEGQEIKTKLENKMTISTVAAGISIMAQDSLCMKKRRDTIKKLGSC